MMCIHSKSMLWVWCLSVSVADLRSSVCVCARACRCLGQQALLVCCCPGRGTVAESHTEVSAQTWGFAQEGQTSFFLPQKNWSYWGNGPGFPGLRVVCSRMKMLGQHVWFLSLGPHLLISSKYILGNCVLLLLPDNP